MILGTGRLSAGWRPDRLTSPGYFLVLVPVNLNLKSAERVRDAIDNFGATIESTLDANATKYGEFAAQVKVG